jgi:hypothetical protein
MKEKISGNTSPEAHAKSASHRNEPRKNVMKNVLDGKVDSSGELISSD